MSITVGLNRLDSLSNNDNRKDYDVKGFLDVNKDICIEYIKQVIDEWGNIDICNDIDNDCPIFSKTEKDCEWLVEKINYDDVEVSQYIHGNYIKSDCVEWEKINDDLLDEIYYLVEQYENLMKKTQKRCE